MTSGSPRILVIRRRYLGDIVLLGSVLANLRLRWPNAQLTVLTEAAYSSVLALYPAVDRALAFPTRPSEWPAFIGALRTAGYSHVLDFDNTDKTALVSRFTGAAARTTYHRELLPLRHRWSYTATVPITNAFYQSHAITETYLAHLAVHDVPIVTREFRLMPSAEDAAWATSVAPLPPPKVKRTLLIHPGSRSAFRLWPPERFAAVCDRLSDQLGVKPVLVAGPGESATIEAIRERTKSAILSVDEVLPVGRFAALARQCGLVLCHDSGPMHVAAAAGARVVALYGSQNATTWQPTGDGHVVLQTALPCACLGEAAPTPCVKEDGYRSYCVRMLDVDTVFQAVAQALRS